MLYVNGFNFGGDFVLQFDKGVHILFPYFLANLILNFANFEDKFWSKS